MFTPFFCMFLLVALAVSVEATRNAGLSLWPRVYVCLFSAAVTSAVIAYLLAKLIK